MAGCISCFILPLILFIFHRYLQPIILKFWNPWAPVEEKRPEGRNGYACPLRDTNEEQLHNDNNVSVENSRLKND